MSGSASPPAAPAPAQSAPVTTDDCNWSSELDLAYRTLQPAEEKAQWIDAARARLLPRDLAERSLTGISQTVVSAIEHRRYREVAALVGPRGLCLRASKGAPCTTLSTAEVAACEQSGKRWTFAGASAAAGPREYTCGSAFRHVFYDRDYLRKGEVHFNCFRAPDGKEALPIVASGPARGYVEFRDVSAGRDPGDERSLWLVFDGDPSSPELVELIAE